MSSLIYQSIKEGVTLIKAFIQGARPATLTAVGVPVVMATTWAFYYREVFDKNLFFSLFFPEDSSNAR